VADSPRQFVLGVDLDGVCADYYPFMRGVIAEWLGRDLESLPPDVGWELTEWGIEPGEFHKVHRFAVVERHLYRDNGDDRRTRSPRLAPRSAGLGAGDHPHVPVEMALHHREAMHLVELARFDAPLGQLPADIGGRDSRSRPSHSAITPRMNG